jgi:hypothetical protein
LTLPKHGRSYFVEAFGESSPSSRAMMRN